jgi:hypothetical protein
MNVVELACFIGLPAIVAFGFLIGTPNPKPVPLAITIGLASAVIALLISFFSGLVFRLFKRRRLQKAPVLIWAVVAVLLSASVGCYLRFHPMVHKSPPNTALEPTPTAP